MSFLTNHFCDYTTHLVPCGFDIRPNLNPTHHKINVTNGAYQLRNLHNILLES